jgi:hypothetical protein
MKKTIIFSMIFMSVFLITGMVSASDTDILQPAATITYNEDLTVNGTGRFDSIYIGKQGVGGVTFFNGTIVNSTTGEDESDNPVTFGDGVRIDGLIWGGPSKGNASDQGLKIADTLLPGLTNVNDIGSNSLRWQDIYAVNGNFSGNLKVDKVEGLDDEDIPDDITVSNYLPLLGGSINGNLNVTGTFQAPNGISTNTLTSGGVNTGAISSSSISVSGDIDQSLNGRGSLKASIICDCTASSCNSVGAWTYDNSLIYCSRTGTGTSTVSVSFNLRSPIRNIILTPYGSGGDTAVVTNISFGSPAFFGVSYNNVSTPTDGDYFVAIY